MDLSSVNSETITSGPKTASFCLNALNLHQTNESNLIPPLLSAVPLKKQKKVTQMHLFEVGVKKVESINLFDDHYEEVIELKHKNTVTKESIISQDASVVKAPTPSFRRNWFQLNLFPDIQEAFSLCG